MAFMSGGLMGGDLRNPGSTTAHNQAGTISGLRSNVGVQILHFAEMFKNIKSTLVLGDSTKTVNTLAKSLYSQEE